LRVVLQQRTLVFGSGRLFSTLLCTQFRGVSSKTGIGGDILSLLKPNVKFHVQPTKGKNKKRTIHGNNKGSKKGSPPLSTAELNKLYGIIRQDLPEEPPTPLPESKREKNTNRSTQNKQNHARNEQSVRSAIMDSASALPSSEIPKNQKGTAKKTKKRAKEAAKTGNEASASNPSTNPPIEQKKDLDDNLPKEHRETNVQLMDELRGAMGDKNELANVMPILKNTISKRIPISNEATGLLENLLKNATTEELEDFITNMLEYTSNRSQFYSMGQFFKLAISWKLQLTPERIHYIIKGFCSTDHLQEAIKTLDGLQALGLAPVRKSKQIISRHKEKMAQLKTSKKC